MSEPVVAETMFMTHDNVDEFCQWTIPTMQKVSIWLGDDTAIFQLSSGGFIRLQANMEYNRKAELVIPVQ